MQDKDSIRGSINKRMNVVHRDAYVLLTSCYVYVLPKKTTESKAHKGPARIPGPTDLGLS